MAKLPADPFPCSPSDRTGVVELVNWNSPHPVLTDPSNFDSSVPELFDPILYHPDKENESVLSKLKFAAFAGAPQAAADEKFKLPPICPACCWLLVSVPFMVMWLALAVESLICGAAPVVCSFRWYTASKLLPHVVLGVVFSVVTP